MEFRMRKPTVLLEAWQVLTSASLLSQLAGFATGHPHVPGFRRRITTSEIVRIDHVEREAETADTLYRLRRRLSHARQDRDGPTAFSLCHLTAQRPVGASSWIVRNGRLLLATDLPDVDASIMTMLLLLDLEGFDDTKR
jgi:hypothetical protein